MVVRLARARFVVEKLPASGGTIALAPAEAAHARARRLRTGDPVLLCDGSGGEARGVVVRSDRRGCEVAVEEVSSLAPIGPDIALYIAGLRPERLAWVVEKATELSARRVVIVRTALTQGFRASAEGLARLERVARAAAKQSGGRKWPEISGPQPFERVLEEERARNRILLDAAGENFPPRLQSAAVALLVGPEGGWTDAERGAARDSGWQACALPAGALRAETAAVAGLILARAALVREVP